MLSDSPNFSGQIPVEPTGDSSSKHHSKKRRNSSSANSQVRTARKKRELWANRSQAVQLRMLVVAAVLFLLVFLTTLVEVLTDEFPMPNLYPWLIGTAALALLIWGVFKLIELYFEQRYQTISLREKHRREEKSHKHKRRRRDDKETHI